MKFARKALFLLFLTLAYYSMMRHEIVFFFGFLLAAGLIDTAADTIIKLYGKLQEYESREDAILSEWPTIQKTPINKKNGSNHLQ